MKLPDGVLKTDTVFLQHIPCGACNKCLTTERPGIAVGTKELPPTDNPLRRNTHVACNVVCMCNICHKEALHTQHLVPATYTTEGQQNTYTHSTCVKCQTCITQDHERDILLRPGMPVYDKARHPHQHSACEVCGECVTSEHSRIDIHTKQNPTDRVIHHKCYIRGTCPVCGLHVDELTPYVLCSKGYTHQKCAGPAAREENNPRP